MTTALVSNRRCSSCVCHDTTTVCTQCGGSGTIAVRPLIAWQINIVKTTIAGNSLCPSCNGTGETVRFNTTLTQPWFYNTGPSINGL